MSKILKSALAFAAGFVAGTTVVLSALVEFRIVTRRTLTAEEFDALWDAGVRDLGQ